jgi:hypothetical protein
MATTGYFLMATDIRSRLVPDDQSAGLIRILRPGVRHDRRADVRGEHHIGWPTFTR